MRRTPALVVPVLLLLVAATGCSPEDAEPDASPEDSPTSSEPTQQVEEEAAETDYFPGVEPADGPLVEMQTVSYRIPAGLELHQDSPRFSGARDADAETWLGVTDVRITAGWDLDRQAREHRKALSSRGTFVRGPDVETPVCTMFTFTGMEGGDRFFAEAGCEVAGTSLVVKATQDQGRRWIVERILHPTLESLELS